MLSAIIIDDEQTGRETLASLISTYCSHHIAVIGEAGSASGGYDMIMKLKPDVVFLDIEMYGENGFDLLDKFNTISFSVIFTTAYSKYSIRAIQYSALDYLLKPIAVTELQDAIMRAKKKLNNQQLKQHYETLIKNLDVKDLSQRIAIPDNKGYSFVFINQIMRCEANGNYTTIFLNSGESIVSSKGLKDYEDLFGDSNFFRVHNSHLVNLFYMKRYEKDGFLLMEDGSRVEVSRRRKIELLEKIASLVK